MKINFLIGNIIYQEVLYLPSDFEIIDTCRSNDLYLHHHHHHHHQHRWTVMKLRGTWKIRQRKVFVKYVVTKLVSLIMVHFPVTHAKHFFVEMALILKFVVFDIFIRYYYWLCFCRVPVLVYSTTRVKWIWIHDDPVLLVVLLNVCQWVWVQIWFVKKSQKIKNIHHHLNPKLLTMLPPNKW